MNSYFSPTKHKDRTFHDQLNDVNFVSETNKKYVRYCNQLGIGMNSIKNDSINHLVNQDDYMIYVDPIIQMVGLFDGYGQRGHHISNFI